ncbi:MAG: hypothetical protein U9N14_04885 [Pseudomonadota bacterium]|nr:hypothetical protein [Pseudomonadota bacterium]
MSVKLSELSAVLKSLLATDKVRRLMEWRYENTGNPDPGDIGLVDDFYQMFWSLPAVQDRWPEVDGPGYFRYRDAWADLWGVPETVKREYAAAVVRVDGGVESTPFTPSDLIDAPVPDPEPEPPVVVIKNEPPPPEPVKPYPVPEPQLPPPEPSLSLQQIGAQWYQEKGRGYMLQMEAALGDEDALGDVAIACNQDLRAVGLAVHAGEIMRDLFRMANELHEQKQPKTLVGTQMFGGIVRQESSTMVELVDGRIFDKNTGVEIPNYPPTHGPVITNPPPTPPAAEPVEVQQPDLVDATPNPPPAADPVEPPVVVSNPPSEEPAEPPGTIITNPPADAPVDPGAGVIKNPPPDDSADTPVVVVTNPPPPELEIGANWKTVTAAAAGLGAIFLIAR